MNKLRLAVTALAAAVALYAALAPVSSAGSAGVPEQPSAPAAEAAVTSTAVPLASVETPDALNAQIQTWIDGLAAQSGFEAWSRASWNRYPLGPGTHGWVVLVKQADAEVGYLIVSATPEGGWLLSEYGAGSSPLFSLTTLYRSLVQLELIPESSDSAVPFAGPIPEQLVIERWYHSPLHALWKVQPPSSVAANPVYLDAKTGEELPLFPDPERRLAPPQASGLSVTATTGAALHIDSSLVREGFDPFLQTSWLRGTPLPISAFSQLQDALQTRSRVVYVADLYDKRVLAPFAVTGFTSWAGASVPFIRLEQEGSRYIPLGALFENGFFFP